MSEPLVLVEALLRTERFFRERKIPAPRLEAELLFAKVLGMSRVQLYLAHDRPLSEEEQERLRADVRRRGQREPLAYVLGSVGFHTLDLQIGPGVLVPRPDTETLVEAALSQISPEETCFVADVGCGSGCIGLAIAAVRPKAKVYAIDPSPEALDQTRRNAAKLGLSDRVAVLKGTYLTPVPKDRPIDWVVSNPPYIPTHEIETLEPEVSKFEPRLALDGGADGLEVVRQVMAAASHRAAKGIFVEIGHNQAPRAMDLLRGYGFAELTSHRDLGGHVRVVGGRVKR